MSGGRPVERPRAAHCSFERCDDHGAVPDRQDDDRRDLAVGEHQRENAGGDDGQDCESSFHQIHRPVPTRCAIAKITAHTAADTMMSTRVISVLLSAGNEPLRIVGPVPEGIAGAGVVEAPGPLG